ncbi:MAG: aminotransferase class I/II-fold pyridoxal phosphate-dependent enzyme [Actinomycetota bacterium]|nr:aminotransferase class I/II-fold pyridoxal phosphate-dependent enzyme [Actinomycetota bacterium]
MKASSRSQVPPFAVMEIIAEANRRLAAGEPVLNLCAGEPSSGAPAVVRERARELLTASTLGYTEATGTPALRAELAGHYRRWYDLDLDPRRIALTTGSSGGFVLAFLAAFEPGDRVALACPGYPAYRNTLAALGCEVVELVCGPETRFQPSVVQLEALEHPVRGLVVAGPANPTGTLVDDTALRELLGWCAEHDVRLISDEIYHGLTYDHPQPGAPGHDRAGAPTVAGDLESGALVVSSFSKYWAMTGWRLGWLVLPDDLVGPVAALAGNLALCPPALSQLAAVEAFSEQGYDAAQTNLRQYATSRSMVLGRLPELGWARAAPADGAFYLYGDIAPTGLDSRTWCARLLDEAGVALTPGTDFDPVHGHDWVRLSFAAAPQIVAEAVDRVVEWQRGL